MRTEGLPIIPAAVRLDVAVPTVTLQSVAQNDDGARQAASVRFIRDPRPQVARPTVREAMKSAEAKLEAWLGRASAPPSVQYAVIYEGRVVHNGALGFKNIETTTATSSDTLYSINSMSKSLTVAAIMQLVERGKVSLSTKVVEVIPEFAKVSGDPALVAGLTLGQLLSHTGRLSRDSALGYWSPGKFWDRRSWPTWAEVVEQLPKARVLANPERTIKYSNLSLMLAGEMVSRLSGRPYEDYVRDNILLPLGMSDTRFSLTEAQLERCAIGYEAGIAKGDSTERAVVPLLTTPGAMGPASGCRSTALDVARWLAFLRDPSTVHGVLDPASVATMKKTVAIDETQDQQFGLGLTNLSLKIGTRAFGHTGSGMGFASVMRMTTDGVFGVVALTNDWSLQQNRAVDIILAELVDVARSPAPAGAPPRDPAWTDFLGSYRRGGGVPRAVTTNARGDLTIAGGPVLTPVPGKADTFVLSGDVRTGDNDEEFFFLRDPTTRAVTHLLTGGTTIENCQRVEVRVS